MKSGSDSERETIGLKLKARVSKLPPVFYFLDAKMNLYEGFKFMVIKTGTFRG